jgi:hypothetical protein
MAEWLKSQREELISSCRANDIPAVNYSTGVDHKEMVLSLGTALEGLLLAQTRNSELPSGGKFRARGNPTWTVVTPHVAYACLETGLQQEAYWLDRLGFIDKETIGQLMANYISDLTPDKPKVFIAEKANVAAETIRKIMVGKGSSSSLGEFEKRQRSDALQKELVGNARHEDEKDYESDLSVDYNAARMLFRGESANEAFDCEKLSSMVEEALIEEGNTIEQAYWERGNVAPSLSRLADILNGTSLH